MLQNKKWRIGKEKVEVLTKLQTLIPQLYELKLIQAAINCIYSTVYEKSSRKKLTLLGFNKDQQKQPPYKLNCKEERTILSAFLQAFSSYVRRI